MMAKKTIKDLQVDGKRVFVRVDFNVPLDDKGHITDDTRIRASLPTIKYIIEHGGIPILASHLGRPKGKADPKLSLMPVAQRLVKLLDRKVVFSRDCIGEETKKLAQNLNPGDVMLLENTRFHEEEKKNDPAFAQELASLADLYVNDAFGTAHRAHATVVGVAEHFNVPVCGFLMAKEIEYLDAAITNPQRPLLAIIGGAKVSTKMGVLKNLLHVVDHLAIGGGMSYTFYKTKGYSIGNSLCEDEFLEEARTLIDNDKLYVPVDTVVCKEPKAGAVITNVDAGAIQEGYTGVDIGENARVDITGLTVHAQTIVWNGPMGIFEIDEFAHGTAAVARAMAVATERGATTIAGGGETIAALKKFGVISKISHVSTGGGASLEFLEGKTLPGIKALKDKE
jgi:3-phosphoglycerate kinase